MDNHHEQRKPHRSEAAPAPFLTKTYEMVDDRCTDEIVSWSDGGATFVVRNTADFCRDLLPNYFKHNNFSSFVRQLNTYGFRKIAPDKWEFVNENFKRGHRDLLAEIRRRKAAAAPVSTAGSSQATTSTSSRGSMTPQLADLAGENERLKREKELLSSQLAETNRQNDEMISLLTRCLNVGRDQIDSILERADAGGQGKGLKLRLFGVWLDEDKRSKKREREEAAATFGLSGPPRPLKSTKVCNQ
ncbi:hypothetical protein SAY87_026857 [Trapa incisa]|uniref:HSF-type DNA-binding domain-containing protein n=1 Tax=Trapa incisa TaxID=236973 RepID=A0AAN7JME8_9MYRT|nr:hypothetical protein SAY87_026857 [Trapa incisa]